MANIIIEPDRGGVSESWAVVYAPRRSRGRFPENCVDIKTTEEQALAEADPGNKRYAARVVGPSRSSEGLKLFYLVRWLDDAAD